MSVLEDVSGRGRAHQGEILKSAALAAVQGCPEPHAQDVHCHCCEGCYSRVGLQQE